MKPLWYVAGEGANEATILQTLRFVLKPKELKIDGDSTMRHSFLLLLIATLSSTAFANCYVLQNNTDSIQTWHFQYAKPLPGEKTDLKLAPHARFPANRDWCWETPSDYYATVRIDAGAYMPSWQGTLVFGNGSNASPSGTYSLEPVRRTSTAPLLFSLVSVVNGIRPVHRRSDDLFIEYADVRKAISS